MLHPFLHLYFILLCLCVLHPWDNVMWTAAWYVETLIKNVSLKITLDRCCSNLFGSIKATSFCGMYVMYNLLNFITILWANANCAPNVERSKIVSDWMWTDFHRQHVCILTHCKYTSGCRVTLADVKLSWRERKQIWLSPIFIIPIN